MLVDDNQVNREIISDYLESMNFQVIQIKNGLEFLEQVSVANPDIVLMDIQMPDINGLELIRRIRSVSEPRIASIPIIALTALVMEGDYERCHAAGANEYLSKPFDLIELLSLIYKTLNQD
jgi:CheY-like chemotaxis protein